jgi:hypothetical protein
MAHTGCSVLPARIPVSGGAVLIRLRERIFIEIGAAHSLVPPGGARIRRHNEVMTAIANAARDQGWHVQEEPAKLVATNRSRPDLLFSRAGERLATDATVVFDGGARARRGEAIKEAASSKTDKWRSPMQNVGYRFIPFACGESGNIGSDAVELLCLLLPPSAVRRTLEATQAAIAEGALALYLSANSN